MDSRKYSLLVLCAVLSACWHDDPNLNSLRESSCETLSGGEYIACYGPGWDAGQPRDRSHYSFYEVDVQKPQGTSSSLILFTKRFAVSDVAPSLLRQGHADVLRYDTAKKTVTFVAGREPVSFVIP
jgi:hypothetical protein